ncbi:MAG: 50S ribosomal protein L30 [Bacteroidetes bacterium]|nr:50S ribosomal protein L30 [Bacteroidota bacterium]
MKVRITQVKSTIKRERSQKGTMRALGLGKLNQSVEHEVNPQVLGMIKKVSHLVKLEEV